MMSCMDASGVDFVFAGLQRTVIAVSFHRELEHARIADQSAPFQLVGDVRHSGVGLNQEGRRGLPRPRRFKRPLSNVHQDQRGKRHQDNSRHQEIQEHDELVSRLARAL